MLNDGMCRAGGGGGGRDKYLADSLSSLVLASVRTYVHGVPCRILRTVTT